MPSSTPAAPVNAGVISAVSGSTAAQARSRHRARIVIACVTVASFALLADLLLVGHVVGEEIWGPVTAVAAALVGTLSLAYLAVHGRSRVARVALYALWAMVALFGIGGYNDHRLPRPVDTIADQRERPPLAPLSFTALAIVGAVALRNGARGE